MLNYNFDPEGVYVVPCTFGPDSMALIDMLMKVGVKPVVAAINYSDFNKRKEDYDALEAFCKEHDLPYEYMDTAELPEEKRFKEGTDFVEWARETRYAFFRAVYDKHEATALVLAHHQDDILEAYLNQKERKVKKNAYDFHTVSTNEGMLVVRPLIQYTKEDLRDYLDENHVPYSLEEEKYEELFTRSKVRKEVIAHLSEIERENLLEEMKYNNDDEIKLMKYVSEAIDEGEELEIRTLISLSPSAFASTLTKFIAKGSAKVKLTPAKIAAIREFMLDGKETGTYRLADNLYLVKEYDCISLGNDFDKLPYSYVLEAPGKLSTEQFDLDFSMGAEDRKIMPEDYPITIRTAIPTDFTVCDSYLQHVRTLYKSWQMPYRLRFVWPVFVNKNGKIIYVPRYRVGFSEYHTSVLKIHLKEDER